MDPKQPLTTSAYEFDTKHKDSNESFMNEPANPYAGATPLRSYSPQGLQFNPQMHRPLRSTDSQETLIQGAAPLGGVNGSPPRGPTLPNVGTGYRGVAY